MHNRRVPEITRISSDAAQIQRMISVIIPALNEEEGIGHLLQYLIDLPGFNTFCEIIVCDGGSHDSTVEIAKSFASQSGSSVSCIKSKPGRSRQMNAGADFARGDWFFFLHADSYPPETFCTDLLDTIKNGYLSGCYRLRFDDPHPLLKMYSWFTRFDYLPFRFGDQGLLVSKQLFDHLGGFNESYIVMEDNDFVRRIKAFGKQFSRKVVNRQTEITEKQTKNDERHQNYPVSDIIAVNAVNAESNYSQASQSGTNMGLNQGVGAGRDFKRKNGRIPVFRIIPGRMTTSARRYRENGILRLQLVFAAIFILHYAGIPHSEIKSFYNSWIGGRQIVL